MVPLLHFLFYGISNIRMQFVVKKKKKKVGETITVRRLVRLRLLLEGKPRTLSRTLFVFADGNVNVEWRRRARFERSKTEARMNRADAA